MVAKIWKLLPYQSAWVQDQAPVKIIEKSRRIGLSWAEAYDSVMHAGAGQGDISYISFSKDMTSGFIRDCADWANNLQVVVRKVEKSILADEGKQVLVHTIRFDSGRRIEALSSAPRQLRSRGRPGDRVVIDEAAFVDDIDKLIQAAMATRMWGGAVRIISTHNGELNPFALLARDVREGKLDWSLHSVTLRQAIDEGLYRRIAKVQGRAWSNQAETAWEASIRDSYRYPWQGQEELDCIPSSGSGGWLSLEDIHACEAEFKFSPEEKLGPVWIGYDVARRRDLAVIVAIEEKGDRLRLRELVAMQDRSFADQEAVLARMIEHYNPTRVAIDQTGMGEAVVEAAKRRFGSTRIEGVILTSPKRLDVATALRSAFEERRLRIPIDDALRADLRSVKRAPGVTGDRPRLISDGDTDGHADRFWALALAVAASAKPKQEYAFHPIKVGSAYRGFRDDDDDEGTFAARPEPGRWSAGLRG